MMPGPDPSVFERPGFLFNADADRRDTIRAAKWLIAAISLAVGFVAGALWWFDRPVAPEVRPTVQRSWVPAPRSTERAFARLEEAAGGRP